MHQGSLYCTPYPATTAAVASSASSWCTTIGLASRSLHVASRRRSSDAESPTDDIASWPEHLDLDSRHSRKGFPPHSCGGLLRHVALASLWMPVSSRIDRQQKCCQDSGCLECMVAFLLLHNTRKRIRELCCPTIAFCFRQRKALSSSKRLIWNNPPDQQFVTLNSSDSTKGDPVQQNSRRLRHA